jgi:phosphatidylserine/phosphatidylglycerophosphate/cardiolipin synthase-like enzyme
MLIDDEWATVGSCNLHRYSLYGNAELNVAFRHPAAVRSLRDALFQEHLGVTTSGLGDIEALGLFQAIARDNGERRERHDPEWQGLVFAPSAPD